MDFLKSLFGGKKEVEEEPRTAPPPSVKKYTKTKRQVRWQGSRAHLLLLSKYKKPQISDRYSKYADWKDVLGESVTMAINRFKNDGALREATLTEKMSTYTVKKLKPMLKERELPVSGKKAVLISRLVEADPQGMQDKTRQLLLMTLTDNGKVIINDFETKMAKEKEDAISQSIQALKAGKFKEAAIIEADHSAKQVFQTALVFSFGDDGENDPYLFVNRQASVAEYIFGGWPRLLRNVPGEARDDLRLGAAVYTLWDRAAAMDIVGSMTIPETDYNLFWLVHMLWSYGVYKDNLSGWEKSDVLNKVSINTCNDELVCKACESLANRVYSIASVPELPYEKCTSEDGCRCGILPIVD